MPLPEDGATPSGESIYDGPPRFNPYEPDLGPEEGLAPYDPQEAEQPGEGPEEGEDGGRAPEDDLPEFDARHREDFTGLLYLGRLEETFRLFGHTFVIRTLTTEQMAEIGLIVQPYKGTSSEMAVYQSAVVAASVVSVDGQPLPSGITNDPSGDLARVRAPYVMRNWMPPVREAIYNRCFRLELRVRKVLSEMGESSG